MVAVGRRPQEKWEWPVGRFIYSTRRLFHIDERPIGSGKRFLTQTVMTLGPVTMQNLMNGTTEQVVKLLKWVTDHGEFEIRRRVYAAGISPNEDRFLQFERDGYCIQCDPRGSGKYLYTAIWPKQ